MRQCSATDCNVGFTVYGPGITTTSFNSDWWFTDRAVLPSTSGSHVSSDDGMWGGAPGEVNGDGQCYGNTGKTGFYGFGNCNSADSTGITVYYGPNGPKQCPSLKAQLYAKRRTEALIDYDSVLTSMRDFENLDLVKIVPTLPAGCRESRWR